MGLTMDARFHYGMVILMARTTNKVQSGESFKKPLRPKGTSFSQLALAL